MAILNHGSTIRTADGGQSTTTIVTASNIGSYAVASSATYYIGTTQNVFNRASGAQTLTGVSIDGNAANITAYTINQNLGTSNTPSFAGLVSSAITNYAFLQVTDTNNFWITPGNNNWGLYFETSAGGLLGGSGDSNRLGFVGAGAARFYVDLNNGNGWFGASLTANTDSRSPIFYDSNNTAYYIDAASTSVINALSVSTLNNINAANGTWHTSSEGKARFYFASNNTTYFRTGNDYVFRNNSDIGVVVIDSVGNLRTSTSGDNSPSYSLHVGGTGFASADFRAPIFYDSDNTAYYVDAASTSVLNRLNYQQLRRNFGSATYSGPPSGSNNVKTFSGVLVAGSANGSTNSYTVIETNVPQGSYQMGGFTINWFENYSSTNGKTKIEIAGYWNPTSNGGFVGFEFTTTNPNIQPTIQVGANASGNTVFILSHFSSNYPVIVARDLWFGYNSTDAEWGTGWTMTNTNSLAAYSNIVSAVCRTGPTLTGSGASGSWGINITGTSSNITSYTINQNLGTGNSPSFSTIYAGVFYDNDDTTYYTNPSVLSNIVELKTNKNWYDSSASAWGGGINMGGNNPSIGFQSTASTWWYMLHHSSDSINFYRRSTSGGWNQDCIWDSSGNFIWRNSSVRAPIFYDFNDTNYYVDPASTSNLNVLVVAASARVGGASSRSSSGLTVGFNNSTTFVANTDVGDGVRTISVVNENSTTNAMSVLGFRVNPNGGTANAMLDVKFVQTGATNTSALYYTFNHGGTFADRLTILSSGNIGVGTSDFSYTINDNSRLVGSNTNNKLFVNGSIQLLGNNDAIVIGRSTATFLSDEELGFGWGGGWYMTDGTYLRVRNDKVLYSAGEIWGSIFKDSNNTAYYVDPASTSVLNRIDLPSGSATINTTTPGQTVYQLNFTGQSTNDNAQAITWGWSTSGAQAGIYVQSSGSYGTKMYIATTDSFATGSKTALTIDHTGVITTNRNYLQATGSLRAPIFYDSDNTAYYVDPASGSNVNNLTTAGTLYTNNIAKNSTGSPIVINSGLAASLGLRVYYDMNLYNTLIFTDASWNSQGAIYGSSSVVNIVAATATTTFTKYAGYSQEGGSFRAPIFYDSDNTAYYVDPASTSNLNGLTVAGGNATIYRDLTINGGASGSYGNRIIVQGTATTYTLQDGNLRPTVYLTGAYPVLTLNHTITNNANHGPTIQFAFNGLTTGGSTSRQIVVGPNGTGTCLDFGFSGGGYGSNSDYNPHNGIAGYSGVTPMRLFSNGLLLGSTGAYPNNITSTSYALDVRGTGYASSDFRAPIFYDSDDTTYYIDAASTSQLNQVASYYLRNLAGVSTDHQFGLFFNNSIDTAYAIYREGGAWTNPYPDLRIAFHTGIKLGANAGYNGIRFYNDYTMATQVMSVNNSGDGLGADNVYVNNSLQAGSSLRSPIYYDSNNTSYYVDPASTGYSAYFAGAIQATKIGIEDGGLDCYMEITDANPTVYGVGYGGEFIFYGDKSTPASFLYYGGATVTYTLQANSSLRSPIFYDSDNTTYYLDPASLSNIRHTIFHVGSNVVGATGVGVLFDGNYTSGQYRHRFRKYDDGAGLPLYIDYAHATANSFTAIARFGGGGSYNPFSVYGTADASGDFRAPIFYDSDNTGYYLNPASSSQLSAVYANDWFRAQGNTGLYFQDKGYGITSAGAAGNSYGNASTYGTGLNSWQGWGIGSRHCLMSNGGDNIGIHDNNRSWLYYWDGTYHRFQYGYFEAAGSVRGPIFYDSDNTGYYIDAAGASIINTVTSAQYYTTGWFRNNSSGNGLYNETTTQHFYSDSANYWNIASSAGAQGIRLRTGGYNGTVRGYFYADTNNDVGILNQDGNWRLRVVGGDYSLADGSSMRAQIFYDSNNTNYYIDAASTSVLNSLTIVGDANLELYKSQTVDMSNTTTYSTSNYYPVTISVPTEGCIIQIQNNLNSNVPSWSTHPSGFTLNLKWRTNGSGWGTTAVRRIIDQYTEVFTNQTICGGITQMINSSTEVVWLRGGGQYFFKFSRNLSATAQSATYTVNSQSVSPTSTAQNTIWNSSSGSEIKYNDQTISTTNMYTPVLYDWNNTSYYVDPASTSNFIGLTVANTITGNISGSSGSCTGNAATATRTSGQSGYPHAGTGMWAFYNWGGSDGGTSAPSASTYTTGLSVGSNPGDQAYGFQIANNMWNTGLWTRNYNSGFGSWIRLLDSSNYVGYSAFTGNVDGTQFRDANDTSFYLDPAGTSNLNKFSTLTMSYNDMNSMHVNSPYVNRYNGSTLYRNGTMGYGTTDCNVMFSNWGSGFIDSWSSPANAPGGSTHYVGFQGFHYNHQNNSQAYGFQMLYAGGTNNRFFWRSAWPDLYSWVEMIHSGNIGSQTVATAGSCTGNSATVTNGVYTNTNNVYTNGNFFQSNLGTTSGSLSSPPLQAYATGTNAAFMSFHRSGNYAVNMGLDSDNVLRIGGWSASANRWELDMSGNNWVASSFRAPIFYDSNDTAYYVDAASTSNLLLVKTRNTFGERVAVSATASTTINTQYNVTELTLAATITTLTLSNIQASGTVHMWTIVTVGGGVPYSITWPAAVKWPGGTAPALTTSSSKRDIYQFVTYDGGTNIYAIIVGQNL